MAEERKTRNARAAVGRTVNGAATLVRGVATLFAVVLVAQIVLTLGSANAAIFWLVVGVVLAKVIRRFA